MIAFETGDIVLNETAQSNDGNGVAAHRLLVVVAQADEEKYANQENNDRDADGGAGKQFEAEMPLAKKPITEASGELPSLRFFGWYYFGVGRLIYHNCHRAAPLPARLLAYPATSTYPKSRVSTTPALSINLPPEPPNALC